MKDSLRLLTIIVILVASVPLLAQKSKKAPTKTKAASPVADARARSEKPTSYEDSAEFDKAFKEIYPVLKPKGSIRDLAEKQVDRQLTVLIKQGIDSAEVVKAAYTGLKEDAAYQIYYDTYRQKLTAKDLKAYHAFLKTPEGAKIHEASLELGRAGMEVNNYVTRTVNTNLMPLRTTLREKMMKSQLEREELMKSDTTEAGRMYRQQMQIRDSMMQARGIKPAQQTPASPDQPAPNLDKR